MEDSVDFIENGFDDIPLYASTSMFLGYIAVNAVRACVNIHLFKDFLSYAKLVAHN